MAKAPKPTIGHNTETIKAEILERTDRYNMYGNQRAAINANMNAERKAIKALEVDMHAWEAARKRRAMDPDVRAEFDRSAALCNDALGVPIQGDMFGSNVVAMTPAKRAEGMEGFDEAKPNDAGGIPGGLKH